MKDAMTAVARHAVLMEAQAKDMSELRQAQRSTDARVSIIERDMPALIETRSYTVRGVIAVVAMVGLALLALVVKQ